MYLCTQNCNFNKDMILDKIDELLKEVQNLSAKNAEEVEQLRLKYLSKKGEITALMNDFREVAADQKKTVGMKINELRHTSSPYHRHQRDYRYLLAHGICASRWS